MTMKRGVAVLSIFLIGCFCGCGSEDEYPNQGTAAASDYGVSDPNNAAFVYVNQSTSTSHKSIKITGGGTWTVSVAPGATRVFEIPPGDHTLTIRPNNPGRIYVGSGWTSVDKFSVEAGRAAVFIHKNWDAEGGDEFQ